MEITMRFFFLFFYSFVKKNIITFVIRQSL